ncbi:MAG TPA: hypothetical protein VGV12_08560 [Gemmatimonadales bacterium]|nr:hypothetical protein [Gemmatimonadales bacterium]
MTPTSLHWARLKVEGPYPVRRGAWYRVTKDAKDTVVLDVRHKPVTVPRSAVELVGTPPRRWTVVPRPARAVMLPETWGDYYAVCPSCQHRAPLYGIPQTMHCPRCSGLFVVAWDEPYLGQKWKGPGALP